MTKLNFQTGTPVVKPGGMRGFIVLVRRNDKHQREWVGSAWYLQDYPLETESLCNSEDCKAGKHEDDGCPFTGWYNDESNFDYQNCYWKINDTVVAWAEYPKKEDIIAEIKT
tara:strand:+ start:158 stop:493 length:336 start_codon:yes stop_codon:yes gene_type:complete